MASAYAKFTGELGVCIATSGPGASHLLTGLYDARLDHMPVLAIAGQQARNAIGGHYQQELDLPSLFKDVAGAFVAAGLVRRPRCAISSIARCASRSASARVTAIILPNDLQEMRVSRTRRASTARCIPASASSQPKTVPYEADLRRAAEVLNDGKKGRDPGRRRRAACDR